MDKFFSFDEIMELPGRYRANLINKVSGFKAANLIGTKSPDKFLTFKGLLKIIIIS